MRNISFETRDIAFTNAAVENALEDVVTETVIRGRYNHIVLEVVNTGATLTDFAFLVKASEYAAGFQTLLSSTEWATAGNVLRAFKGAPHTLVTTASAFLWLNIGPIYSFKVQARCGTSSSVAINGTMSRI